MEQPALIEDPAAETVDMVYEALLRLHVEAAAGAVLAAVIVRHMREIGGGQTYYLPAPDRRTRNAAIRAAFNGTNHAAVCRQFRISRATLYRVLGGE